MKVYYVFKYVEYEGVDLMGISHDKHVAEEAAKEANANIREGAEASRYFYVSEWEVK